MPATTETPVDIRCGLCGDKFLRCYAQASKRRERMARPQREAFDAAIEWAAMGSSEPLTVPVNELDEAEAIKNPA
jgi:hypothetical protein